MIRTDAIFGRSRPVTNQTDTISTKAAQKQNALPRTKKSRFSEMGSSAKSLFKRGVAKAKQAAYHLKDGIKSGTAIANTTAKGLKAFGTNVSLKQKAVIATAGAAGYVFDKTCADDLTTDQRKIYNIAKETGSDCLNVLSQTDQLIMLAPAAAATFAPYLFACLTGYGIACAVYHTVKDNETSYFENETLVAVGQKAFDVMNTKTPEAATEKMKMAAGYAEKAATVYNLYAGNTPQAAAAA